MRFDAVLFDNGGTLTHRTSPVAAVRALAARVGVEISEEDAARYWRRSKELGKTLKAEKRRRNLSRPDHRDGLRGRVRPDRRDRAWAGRGDVRRVEDQPADDGAVSGRACGAQVVQRGGHPDRDRQQHGLVDRRRLRGDRHGRLRRHVRALL